MTSAEMVTALDSAKGEEKAQLLYALGSINDGNANEYYKKLTAAPSRNFHYLCHARCDTVSDYAANILENAVNLMTVFSGTGIGPDGFNELMWTSLNICAFKSSDRLFAQFERIGQNCDKFGKFQIDTYGLIYSKKINPFLANRASKWHACCGESGYIPALNDMLICGITRNGDGFAEKISALADRYPKAFARAGLFADFARDNGRAFDKYGREEFSDTVLSLFMGVRYTKAAGDMLYSPVWFIGNKNKEYHSRTRIENGIDIRWVRYLADIAAEEKAVFEHFRASAAKSSYRYMSGIMLCILSPENMERRSILKEYFLTAAEKYSNEDDFIGLELCGGYSINEVIMAIAENVCNGNSTYYSLYTAFKAVRLKRREKLSLLDAAEEYIRKNDKGKWAAQKETFFKEAQLFRERKNPKLFK